MVELRHRTAKERGQKDRFVSIYVEKYELRFSKKSLVSQADMTFKNRLFLDGLKWGRSLFLSQGPVSQKQEVLTPQLTNQFYLSCNNKWIN